MIMKTYCTALSIAGSDCSGGAGIQADIKTMSALGVYATTAITAITAQNTMGVIGIQGIDPSIVAAQIDAIYADFTPRAVKIGMLFNADIVEAVADALLRNRASNIVLDPVMVATSGDYLIDKKAIAKIKSRLIPMCDVITPNANESLELAGTNILDEQAKRILDMGAKAVILKGGDRKDSESNMSSDYLYFPDMECVVLESKRVDTANTHGTGCTFSSAIASFLAKGMDLTDAAKAAKQYIIDALTHGADIKLGNGHGPVNHLFSPIPLDTTDLNTSL